MAYPKELLGKVAVRRNLYGAWEDISRSARPLSHGTSEQTVQDFGASLSGNIEGIRNELLSGKYKFKPVRAVIIKKKSGKKRPLRIADVRDRVVQRAITRVLENEFNASISKKSSGFDAFFDFLLASIVCQIQDLPDLFPDDQAGRIREYTILSLSHADFGGYPRKTIKEFQDA